MGSRRFAVLPSCRLTVLLGVLGAPCAAQARIDAIYDAEKPVHDAVSYTIRMNLPETGKRIAAVVGIQWRVNGSGPLTINLDSVYTIESLTFDRKPAHYERHGDTVSVATEGRSGTVVTEISYSGEPRDGLVIRGEGWDRTIFADNWPNRARKWLASQDHPSDKATVQWTIEAPAWMTVLANGEWVGSRPVVGDRKEWRFVERQSIPVYTMVLGAARLAVTSLPNAMCQIRCVPVSIVTYPADSAWAVNGPFRRASEMIDFFSDLIAPFPYEQLRHVETSTIFGGMENSTLIFYDEKGYQRKTLNEGTVFHETAHQWFGDAATEADWHHLWLSEGFATYAAALWTEHKEGAAALKAAMAANKLDVVRSPATERPIIDPGATNLMGLLNSNNYPKGSWVLHTLRGMIGDSAFFRGLRRYYKTYEHKNALSADLARIMSEEAGENLTWYFTQALTQPGYPILAVAARLESGRLAITLRQVQKAEWGRYRLPNLTLKVGDQTVAAPLTGPESVVTIPWSGSEVPTVSVDPDGWWLVEEQHAS
ncbi:MAG: M1 family metallopeptidase [Gemmatimonadota bacterium]